MQYKLIFKAYHGHALTFIVASKWFQGFSLFPHYTLYSEGNFGLTEQARSQGDSVGSEEPPI